MPPEGERLSAAEIGLLRTWIDQGAIWPKSQSGNAAKGADHWAFKRPVRPAVPSIKNTGWSRNAIDQFVLARLEASGLRPAPEAGRATLARRLWLDLLGLLPPVEEVSRFVADPDPSAYEQLVERLLASPHFGERWGRHWLDLARYADSSGYESDTPRSVWRYRDWVIRAINADMPFDQFAIEQLAGDLLPNASADETVASGFQANAMLDPGVRWESVLDQVNTTGTVFLGLTVGWRSVTAISSIRLRSASTFSFTPFSTMPTSPRSSWPRRRRSGLGMLRWPAWKKSKPRGPPTRRRSSPPSIAGVPR